jgi:DNA-binding transcriptional ArsR family regulator
MHEVKKTLYWILAGTMGGDNRARILEELFSEPQNTNQLSKKLKLDFKTVQYHLKVLEKNGLVTFHGGGGFAKLFFPSRMLEDNHDSFKEILDKIKEQKSKKNR